MEKHRRLVLVVDDDEAIARSHAALLERIGYATRIETDPLKVEPFLAETPDVDLVLLDLRMPALGGMELLQRLRVRFPRVGVVMATVVNDVACAVEAMQAGARSYVLKPIRAAELRRILDAYFAKQPPRVIGHPAFASIVTGDPALQAIFRTVQAFAEQDVPVLIQGETGTGKELFAQAIHALSPRAAEPFLPASVAALCSSIFESELFGAVQGAYTSATAREGYFHAVGKGTLFMDEVGELGTDQQVKLLRVTETRQYQRLGSAEVRKFEGRLVLATNRDLTQAMKERRVREDFYYRIAEFSIRLPPLRERPGDVALLANHFLDKWSAQFGKEAMEFSPGALAVLKGYSFPGNVRQLEGLVRNAILIQEGRTIQPSSLPEWISSEGPSGQSLESVQVRAILTALRECAGNQTVAAKRLGMSRPGLNRILKRYREARGGKRTMDGDTEPRSG